MAIVERLPFHAQLRRSSRTSPHRDASPAPYRDRFRANSTMVAVAAARRYGKDLRAVFGMGGLEMQGRARGRILALVLLTLPWVTGMGSLGGQEVITPPVDFHARLIDRDSTAVDLNRVNIDGRVVLEGEYGRGNLRIPFENIDLVEFQNEARGRTVANVRLTSGEAVSVQLPNSLTFYGQTPLGLYQIRARDMQRLEFAH